MDKRKSVVLHQTPLLFRYIITRVELLAYHHEAMRCRPPREV